MNHVRIKQVRAFWLREYEAYPARFRAEVVAPLQAAILGNVGTIMSFRVGPTEAELLAREFHPTLNESDLMNLPNHAMYVKLLVDGKPTQPFSAETLPPPG